MASAPPWRASAAGRIFVAQRRVAADVPTAVSRTARAWFANTLNVAPANLVTLVYTGEMATSPSGRVTPAQWAIFSPSGSMALAVGRIESCFDTDHPPRAALAAVNIGAATAARFLRAPGP